MTEAEKLRAGLPFSIRDPEICAGKLHGYRLCRELEALGETQTQKREAVLRELFGHVGVHPSVFPGFRCEIGSNISVGDEFMADYGVTILDISPVTMGDFVWLGPHVLITTLNHPLSHQGRRQFLGISKAIHIGDDVWIGGNSTILPGVTIGSRVVVAAGAVVHRDVPDDVLVGGVPARILRHLPPDLDAIAHSVSDYTGDHDGADFGGDIEGAAGGK